MLRKSLFILAGIVVLLIVAILVGPSFVDWNQYKPQIAAEVEKATGRNLAIDGDLSLSILPAPTLTAEGVRFANIEGGSNADMATLEALDVRVAFGPLLSGDIQVTSVTLVSPTILLEKLPDGSVNWEIAPPADAAAADDTATTETTTEEETAEAPDAGTTQPAASGGMQIGIDKVTIENGTLVYIDHVAGSEQRVESLDAEIRAPSLQGPFSLEGDAIAAGFPLGFDISTGRIVEAQPIEVSLAVTLDDGAASLRFGGTVATGEQLAVDGTLAGEAADLGAVMEALGGTSTPALEGKPFSLSGTVESSQSEEASAIRMDDFEVQLGDMTATGAFEATLGDTIAVDTTLRMGVLDADALIEAFGGSGEETADSNGDGDGTTETASFALPTGIDAAVDLTIDAVNLKGGVVNQVQLVAHLLPEGMLTIERLSAQMPGGSTLSVAGDVAPAEGVPSFAGVLEASSDNLRALMAWLGVEAAGVPNDRLRNLSLASRVTASQDQIQLGEIDMRLDNSQIQGGVVIALPNDTRPNPAFGIGLAVDQINLDAYMPPATDNASEGNADDEAGNPLGGLAPLADINANVELRVGALTLNGQQVEGLHLDGTLDGGTLTLRDLSVAQFAGGSGTVTGTITDLAGAPRFDTRIDLDVADATRAMQTAGMADAPAGLGRMTVVGTVAGGAEDVAYDVAFTIAGIGAEGSAKGTAAGLGAGIPRIDSDFSLDAADAGPLFAIAGMPVPEGADLGALSLSGTASSGDDDLTYDVTLALTGAGTTGSFKGTVSDLSATPRVDTTLDLQAGEPTLLLALAGVEASGVETLGALGLSGSLAGNTDDMTLDVDLTALGGSASIAGNVAAGETATTLDLTLSADHPELKQLLAALSPDVGADATAVGPLKLSGKIEGSTAKFTVSDLDLTAGPSHVSGNVSVDMTTARPQFAATLNGDTVDVTPFMGPGGGGGGGGDGEQWSSEPLDLSVLDSADGTIDLKAASFIAGETRIDNLDARAVLQDGVLTVERMTGNVYGGSIDLAGTRITGRGTPTARIRAIANGLDSSELMSGGMLGATFDGPVSFTGNFDTQGASMAELMNQLDGTGNVDGSIQVLTSTQQAIGSALLGILGQQVEQVRGITDVMNAVFAAFTGKSNSLTGDFIVTDGVMQTDNTRFANDAAALVAQGTADIGAWSMDMLAEIYRQQSGDSPFMVLDLTGPMSGPNVALNRSDGGDGAPTGLIESLFPGGENAPDENLSTEDAVDNLLQGIIPGMGADDDDGEATTSEPLDPSAPGAAGLTVPEGETEAIDAEDMEPGAIAPEDEPEATAEDVVEEEPAAEEPVEPVEEPGAAAPPDEEPDADKSEEVSEEPIVEEPAAEEPPADETTDQAPGASGLTAEPEAAPADEPVAEEPVVEEPAAEEPAAEPGAAPGTEPVTEPGAEPEAVPTEEPLPEEEESGMAPGATGVEPGAESVTTEGTEEPGAVNLLQGILGTDQQ
ncbi:MAG: AsmA family protein [Dongiaceae bacterium]